MNRTIGQWRRIPHTDGWSRRHRGASPTQSPADFFSNCHFLWETRNDEFRHPFFWQNYDCCNWDGGHLEAMEVNHLMCWVPPNLSIHHLDLESSNIQARIFCTRRTAQPRQVTHLPIPRGESGSWDDPGAERGVRALQSVGNNTANVVKIKNVNKKYSFFL